MRREWMREDVVEELLDGINDWKSVQGIVRLTFKELSEVVKAQGSSIKQLQFQIQSMKKEELTDSIDDLRSIMNNKVSLQEVVKTKADKSELYESLQNQVSLNQFNDLKDEMKEVKNQLQRILVNQPEKEAHKLNSEVLRELQMKADKTEVAKMIAHELSDRVHKTEFEHLRNFTTQLKREIRSSANEPLDPSFYDSLYRLISQKASIEEVTSTVQSYMKEVNETLDSTKSFCEFQVSNSVRTFEDKFKDLEFSLYSLNREMKDLGVKVNQSLEDIQNDLSYFTGKIKNSQLGKSNEKTQVLRMLDSKVSTEQLSESLNKAHEYFSQEVKSLRLEIQNLFMKHNQLLNKKIDKKNSERPKDSEEPKMRFQVYQLEKFVEEVRNQLLLKPSTQEVNSLLDKKINSLTCKGIWLWKSGEVKDLVPWEYETLNTCPSNLVWEGPTIVTTAPGLYQVTYGFFAEQPPLVSLLVNEEVVMTGGNSDCKSWQPHSAGNVVGLTNLDYLSLPSGARISMTYSGNKNPEAFIILEKL